MSILSTRFPDMSIYSHYFDKSGVYVDGIDTYVNQFEKRKYILKLKGDFMFRAGRSLL